MNRLMDREPTLMGIVVYPPFAVTPIVRITRMSLCPEYTPNPLLLPASF